MDRGLRFTLDEAGPRNAPQPRRPNEIPLTSAVPDVSLIFSPDKKKTESGAVCEYEEQTPNLVLTYRDEERWRWRNESTDSSEEHPAVIVRLNGSGERSNLQEAGQNERDYVRNNNQERGFRKCELPGQVFPGFRTQRMKDSYALSKESATPESLERVEECPVVVNLFRGSKRSDLHDHQCCDGNCHMGNSSDSARSEMRVAHSLAKKTTERSYPLSKALPSAEELEFDCYRNGCKEVNIPRRVHSERSVPHKENNPLKKCNPCSCGVENEQFPASHRTPTRSSENNSRDVGIQHDGPVPARENVESHSIYKAIHANQDILGKLFEQMLIVQHDQMKLLKEINHKLSSMSVQKASEEITPGRSCADSATQTSVLSKTVSQSKDFNNEENNRDLCITRVNVMSSNDIVKENNAEPDQKGGECSSWRSSEHSKSHDESLTLHGVHVPTVIGPPPSFVSAVHLHMQDYHHSSASLFDNVAESFVMGENMVVEGARNGNWTLYNNIVGHVKKFLQPDPSSEDPSAEESHSKSSGEPVRVATLERIRELGVNVYENSTEIKEVSTRRVQFGSVYQPDYQPAEALGLSVKSGGDASVGICSLAMKYLKDDELCELAEVHGGNKTNPAKAPSKSSNLSLATQNYLEKYNLLPNSSGADEVCVNRPKNKNQGSGSAENILDITTLKKQTKLL